MSTQTFGKYQLIKRLATGGMAEVWLARQTGIEGFARHVVIKRILPHLSGDPEFIQMFLNEAKLVSHFTHPNIAQIFDLGEENGTYFIAMEFVQGEDLGRVMRRARDGDAWIAPHLGLKIASDACQGLYYAHTRSNEQGRPLKVVHRDISPQNILVSFDGSVKLVDFGIAKAADQATQTKSGALKGKFAYMAPEQAAGRPVDARTDIFALGLVLYELLTGIRPFKRETEAGTLQAVLECRIDAPSEVVEVSSDLDRIVLRALAKSPDERYRDAREFQREIDRYLIESRHLATSNELADLMEALFADRRREEARLGEPSPPAEPSVNDDVLPPVQRHTDDLPRAGRTVDEEPSDRAGPSDRAQPGREGEPRRPYGTVGLSRRYASKESRVVENARPRAKSLEMTRADARSVKRDELMENLDDESGPAPTPPPAPPPRRISRRTVKKPSREIPTSDENSEFSLAPDRPVPANSPLKVITQTTKDPETDRRGTWGLNLVNEEQSRHANTTRNAIVATLIVAVLVAGFFLKDSFRSSAAPAGEVRLRIETTPPTKVLVRPAPGNKERSDHELGFTPIRDDASASLGDTLVLTNEPLGIRVEVPIDTADADGLFVFERRFAERRVRITTRPKLANATVWRGQMNLASLPQPFLIYPGTHQLELRSTEFDKNVPFELAVSAETTLLEHEVDVRASLKGK
jgi:serine/threonine protein kinase